MKNLVKFIVPLLLGIGAAVFNFVVLSNSVKKVSFIKATQEIKIGDEFADKVERLEVLDQHATSLKEAAVRFSDIGLLRGQTATRNLQPGDVVLYRDTGGLVGQIYDFRGDEIAALPVSLDGITTPPRMNVGDLVQLKIPPKLGDAPDATRWIGPFRLLSVGSEISNTAEVGESRRISIAYDMKNNKRAIDELEAFIDRRYSGEEAKLIGIKLQKSKENQR